MSAATPESGRAGHLNAFFRDVLAGKRQLNSSSQAQLFLESICSQQPATACVEKIISKPAGFTALTNSVRADLSTKFIQSYVLKLMAYLSDPAIKSLASGQFLRDILVAIVEPPTVWRAVVGLFLAHNLSDDCLQPFAWLVHELISMPSTVELDVLEDVKTIVHDGGLLHATAHEVREFGYKIKRVLDAKCSPDTPPAAYAPGGRHDNDFEDFRKISIYPTTDEFLSTEVPFYRKMDEVFEVDEANRAATHIDNQYRLLREDMLAELRNDLHVAVGKKQNKGRRVLTLGGLRPERIHHGDDERDKLCSLAVACYEGLGLLREKSPSARKAFLKDNPSFLRHEAFGVLCKGEQIFGFAFVERDIDLLAEAPPVVLLRFAESVSFERALVALKSITDINFMLVDTPVFAYEPVLKGLKSIHTLPLQEQLLQPSTSTSDFTPVAAVKRKLEKLQACRTTDGSTWLPRNRSCITRALVTGGSIPLADKIQLDRSQTDSLIRALEKPVALIQGPPGTGKSFIGALIVKILAEAGMRVLVITYTNHALCQFMNDLHKAGIEWDSMVRMGSKSKCSPETAQILLSAQQNRLRLSMESRSIIDSLKTRASALGTRLSHAFAKYKDFALSWNHLSEFLEFSEDDGQFFEAFVVPEEENGWKRAGRNRQQIGPDYLYRQWSQGRGPGLFSNRVRDSSRPVWEMSLPARKAKLAMWTEALMHEHVQKIQSLVSEFDDIQNRLTTIFSEGKVSTLKSKKIIGCTTTSAAKQTELIRNAEVDIVMVEEAGEILESHVLTALSPSVKQVILIGDHKQLRPKVNNYRLTVEKGEGFNLNMSLFERMICQGAPHTTLQKQHRMSPEISLFVRGLTYPDLVDHDKTKDRPRIRGLRDRVVFFNHLKQEETENELADRRDPGVKGSKKNVFEAEVVLNCVKYLIQQGYQSDKIVVLTPYLGQLRLLRDRLKDRAGVDPVLNDLDSGELLRAGLLTEAAAKFSQKPLRISTIDNYQGEESEIVIGSLTRSNESGDIGFMARPERLNVLLSRARSCLVLVGNMETFMRSKRGQGTWQPFFELLKRENNLYDGLPVRCEQHPNTTALLREPADFERFCPDGGCSEPCGELLRCNSHVCNRRCHRIRDHSNVNCTELVEKICSRQHKRRVQCSRQTSGCSKCAEEDKETARRVKRDLKMESDRLARQEAYRKELQEIEDELDHQRRLLKYEAEKEEQKKNLQQQRADLESLKDSVKRAEEQKARQRRSENERALRSGKPDSGSPTEEPADPGTVKSEWQQLKNLEGAKCTTLDELMGMIGLEDVKAQFLSVKSKVDTTLRQNSSLKSERFSCSLLGNPGTGKTTVARLYGKFLNSVGVIPGSRFEESTGSKLANMGVSGCKQLLDDIQTDGGGVLFIDEAYQLSSSSTPGGGAVLDFLLAEVENLTGKVVFVLAGYTKQMEAFFAHNPGLPSRFPREMKFADYTDDELLRILILKIDAKYGGSMKCEDGLDGLYTYIVARRIGYGRGSDGFGNARTVENTLARISDRQANRLRRERSKGATPDDFLFRKEDLIGPEPSDALAGCEAWRKLQAMAGLSSVKTAVKSLVDTIAENYRRELEREQIVQCSLNRVFLGNPGTGKTTVAKLLGQILVHLGLLSKGEVVVKNPSDFLGAHLGQSEQQTKGILAATVGKVLVLDEAYGLYPGGSGTSDPYKTAVIDTIVAEVQSVPGDDRCLLLLGYKDQMEEMFQNVNPGLSRRFPLSSAFVFEDFTDDELQYILTLKLKQQGFEATGQAKTVVKEMLSRARNRPNYGNAGEIDILLGQATARHQSRLSKGETKSRKTLEALDFDENFDRAERTETNIRKLFDGTVGCNDIVDILEGYQETVRTMKGLEMDPKESIPFNFLFRGPPGTGKTTTAKKIGKVFYDMGFLATTEVIECSASDIIGQYVGQTAPKVRQILDKALGKVLFLDEAYRLCDGPFAKEAVDELVDAVTKDAYFKKIIVILAGYEQDINRLMSINSGLTSRFPEVINFRALSPTECVDLLCREFQRQQNRLAAKGHSLDLSSLEQPTEEFRKETTGWFAKLTQQDNWASARDVKTVTQGIFTKTIKGTRTGTSFVVREEVISAELKAMFDERESRSNNRKPDITTAHDRVNMLDFLRSQVKSAPAPPQASTATTTSFDSQTTQENTQASGPVDPVALEPEKPRLQARSRQDTQRDAGVSDEVWEQLQKDKAAEEAREAEYQAMLKARDTASEEAREEIVKRVLGEARYEQEYQMMLKAREIAREEARKKIAKRLLEEGERRRQEAEMRRKLAAAGVCPAGFQWIKQEGGYRCAGGSHFISQGQLAGI